jgi:tRNA-splicing ligase RtcB
MTENTYNVIKPDNGVPIKAWTKGVPLEDAARQQLLNVAQLPFIYKWVAAMPDVHWGIGATVGSVIPTRWRDYSGGGRCGHWLRHDGSADFSARQPSAGQSARHPHSD